MSLQAIRVGSFDIDAAIQTYIRREYGIAVGERTAEEIKMAIGSACPMEGELKAEVRGRDLMSGLPKTVILSPNEIRQATEEPIGAIAESVLRCLGQAPPELAQDLILQGIHLVGGGGLLQGMARRLSEAGVRLRYTPGRTLRNFRRYVGELRIQPRKSSWRPRS